METERGVLDYELDLGSDTDPYMNSGVSTSYGLYLTPEKALSDLYDKYAPMIQDSPGIDPDAFIEERILDRIEAFESREEDGLIEFSVNALDDEASWVLSRYPQFVMGTLLGLGGVGYSALNQDIEPGAGIATAGGLTMTYTAFNGTAETVDKILSFGDNVDIQQQLWNEALELHQENGFTGNGASTVEVNQTWLHPIGASHTIGYRSDDNREIEERFDLEFEEQGDWKYVDFADSSGELLRERGDEVAELLYKDLVHVAPTYVSQMTRHGLDKIWPF